MIRSKMRFAKADCVIGWDTEKSRPVRVGKRGAKMLARFLGKVRVPVLSAAPQSRSTMPQPVVVTKAIENESEFVSAAYLIGGELGDDPVPA